MRFGIEGKMSEKNYMLAVDQSTSGTKALLFDRAGALIARKDLPHRQIIIFLNVHFI